MPLILTIRDDESALSTLRGKRVSIGDIIMRLSEFGPEDWSVLIQERITFRSSGEHWVYCVYDPTLLQKIFADMRAQGAYSTDGVVASTRHHAAAPLESVEASGRRAQLVADLQRLAQLVPSEQREDTAKVLRRIRGYIATNAEMETLDSLIREQAKWALGQIENRRDIASDNPLSISELCAVIYQLVTFHTNDDEQVALSERRNMRFSLVRRLADCVEMRDGERYLICANGQGQQLVSALHGYGLNLPSEDDAIKATPAEMLTQVSQDFSGA